MKQFESTTKVIPPSKNNRETIPRLTSVSRSFVLPWCRTMTAVSHSHRRRTHCVRSKLKSDIAGFKPDGFDVPSFFAAGNRVATGPASQPGFHFEMTLFASPLFFGQRRLFREQQTMSSITPAERWFKVTRSPRLPTLCAFLRKLQEVVCTPQHGLPRAPGTAIGSF